MQVYIIVSIAILLFGLFYEYINSRVEISKRVKKLPMSFFFIPSFLLLLFVSSMRGDFTADYNNYIYLFNLYNQFDFLDIFKADFYQEIGYVTFSRLIGGFTSNELFLFGLMSFLTLLAFFWQFKKYSAYIWLSVFMFVTVGSYYTSFNTMRQILAVAIIFAGSKFLYDRKFFKYLLVVSLAALFHKTALVMIVFYFLLNIKVNFRNTVAIITSLVLSFAFLNNLLAFAQQFFYEVYTSQSYGMSGLSFSNAILPLAFLAFTLIYIRHIDLQDNIKRIWVNAAIFYAFFSVLGLIEVAKGTYH